MSERSDSSTSDQQHRQSAAEVAGRRRTPTRTTKKSPPPKQDHLQSPLSDDVEDFQCPICIQILIEPITLCCNGKHTLCTPCFEGLVEQGSMECPLCKLSIHRSWVRKHKVTGLLNTTMWEHIQLLFPDDVRKRRIQDEQGASCSNDVCATAVRNRLTHQLAEPGEIGAEFRAQAAKLAEEMHTKENGERLRQLRMVELADDVLARQIQNLGDSVDVDEVLHGQWDAVMESVQKKLGDKMLTPLNPNDVFKEMYGTELQEKKNKEGPIIYPPEAYEEDRSASNTNGPMNTQQQDEVDDQDIFAELDLDCDGNWQPALEQADELMTQSSEYSVELDGAALLLPRSTYDNPDSLLFANPAFVPPINSRRSSYHFTPPPSRFGTVTPEQTDNNDLVPSNKENVAKPPIAQKYPPITFSFLGSQTFSSADDERVSPAAFSAEPVKMSTEEAQRNETCAKACAPKERRKAAGAQSTLRKISKISKEAVRKMLLGSPKRRMGGRLLFRSKKRSPTATTDQRAPIDSASSVDIGCAETTSSPIVQERQRPRAQKNARKRAIDSDETPPESKTARRKRPSKSPPLKDQSASSKAGVRSKKMAKAKKELDSRSTVPSSPIDTSLQPPKQKRMRRTIERPALGDPQEVLDKKLAVVLQRQFDDEESNCNKSFSVRRELGTDQYYNFRRKSLAKSFTSTL